MMYNLLGFEEVRILLLPSSNDVLKPIPKKDTLDYPDNYQDIAISLCLGNLIG